ncbi:MAG TPA: DHH family phosphoesterase [Acidobacteriaceae bacterium]|nr:DHH family phosphoesterase [Acidobacteriaceae bacterium]
MECRVFHHDHCFDGACSASVFTRFHRECIGTASEFSYRGLVHGAGSLFDEGAFGAGENAVVDFKYYASPKATWWFDHHLSAFASAADREDFLAVQAVQAEARAAGNRAAGGRFYDADYVSCTSLIADVAREMFGFDTAPLKELIYWADIVDGARYESAEAAVGMAAPAMKLTMAIEASGAGFVPRVIPLLTEMSLADVVDQPFVQEELGPLMERHLGGIELLRERIRLERGVVTFDITDTVTEGYSKFIPYYLYPAATYTVGLSRSSFRTKISVGTNPWTKVSVEELVNLAEICERYGGGGHARVGAISFAPDKVEDARAAAKVIAEELRGESVGE